jgi:hypothetical protein
LTGSRHAGQAINAEIEFEVVETRAMVRRLLLMLVGAGYYLGCVARLGFYRGHQRFYATAQDTGALSRAAKAVLTSPPAQLVVDYSNLQSSLGRDRISPMAAADYSDDSLAGYADGEFAKGGAGLEGQQRALALPMIKRVAAALPQGATLMEIGMGNGDVCAHLAEEFPDLKVVRVDLSTAVAEAKARPAEPPDRPCSRRASSMATSSSRRPPLSSSRRSSWPATAAPSRPTPGV